MNSVEFFQAEEIVELDNLVELIEKATRLLEDNKETLDALKSARDYLVKEVNTRYNNLMEEV